MLEMVIHNLQMIGFAMALLATAWTANMVLGLYYSTVITCEGFDKKRLVTGILKLLAVCVGTALSCIVITLFPEFLSMYGIQLAEEAIDTFSVVVIATAYAVAIAKYIKEFMAKLLDILK